MITFKHEGSFKNTDKFFSRLTNLYYRNLLDKYAQEGVVALASATPIDTGETATSWDYTITETKSMIQITWTNSNIVDGVPIALVIQYGHATRNGGYVQGRDYINPAIVPIFDKILENVWREVTSV